MSDYYDYGNTLTPGASAKAEEVTAELQGIQAGFDLLPTPRTDAKKGFDEPIYVPEAIEDGQASTWGQLKGLEEAAAQSSADADQFRIDAASSAGTAQTSEAICVTKASESSASALAALTSQGEASDWAVSDIEIEPGLHSAKHYAELALQVTSGARTYIGGWDASGGALPIASPDTLDKGKFWRVTVAGTLPVVGTVDVEDELAIREDLTYEVLPSNASVQSVNGFTGVVNITWQHTGAAPLSHGHSVATITTDGYMSAADKVNLDNGQVPIGGCIPFDGDATALPPNWRVCDGTSGTPNLIHLFVRGGTNDEVGDVGGSDAHGHSGSALTAGAHSHGGATGSGGSHSHSASSASAGSHAHTISVGGRSLSVGQMPSHRHGSTVATNTSGSGVSAFGGSGGTATTLYTNYQGSGWSHDHSASSTSAGSHSHSVTVSSAGTHSHSITSDSGHAHSLSVDSSNNVPAYYTMVWIKRVA